jgi:hypothetical protein
MALIVRTAMATRHQRLPTRHTFPDERLSIVPAVIRQRSWRRLQPGIASGFSNPIAIARAKAAGGFDIL